jgi:hypothetical protein
MRARAACVLVTALVVIGAGSAPAATQHRVAPSIANGSAQRHLAAARARWRRHGPRSYTYRLQLTCFCTPDSRRPHTFVVRDGRPVKPPKGWRAQDTAPKLFKLVAGAIHDRVDGLHVTYYRSGLLKELDVDQNRRIADDEQSFFVDRFSSP